MVVQVPGVVALDLFEEPGLLGAQGFHVGVGQGELLVHGVVAGENVDDRLDALPDDLDDGLGGIEVRLLFEQADCISFAHGELADEILVHSGDDPQQRGFPGPVQPEDADLGPIVEAEGDVFEDLAVGRMDPAHPAHAEDDLRIGRHGAIVPESPAL